jgi:hypothetical protein
MLCLNNTDEIEGGAATDAVVEYSIHGLVGTTFTQLATGVMNTTLTTALYTAGAAVSVVSIILVNTHSTSVAVTLRLAPTGSNPRYIIPETISLGAGYSLHTDGQRITVMDTNGATITASTSGAVLESDFDANTILAATADDTPAALTVAEQTLVGRITAGEIDALTATEARTLLNVADGADVTSANTCDTPNIPIATDVLWDAKGDLAGGTGADTAAKLTVGTNDYVLTADSAEATGMKWAEAPGSSSGITEGEAIALIIALS